MRKRHNVLAVCLGILLFGLSAIEGFGAEAGAPEIRVPEENDVPIVMNFTSASAAEMIKALSMSSGMPMSVDECVKKRHGSLAMSKITISDALKQIVRIFDLEAVQRGDTLHIGCTEEPGGSASPALDSRSVPTAAGHLRFTVERVKRKLPAEVIYRPRLLVPSGSQAEIVVGTKVTSLKMTDQGGFLWTPDRPSLSIEVFFEPKTAPENTLRGIFRTSVTRDGTLYNLSGKFDSIVPPFSKKVELCRLRIPRETWILSVVREQ